MMMMSGGDFGVEARLILWNVGRDSHRNIILTRVESIIYLCKQRIRNPLSLLVLNQVEISLSIIKEGKEI